jgi:hypothetical protein
MTTLSIIPVPSARSLSFGLNDASGPPENPLNEGKPAPWPLNGLDESGYVGEISELLRYRYLPGFAGTPARRLGGFHVASAKSPDLILVPYMFSSATRCVNGCGRIKIASSWLTPKIGYDADGHKSLVAFAVMLSCRCHAHRESESVKRSKRAGLAAFQGGLRDGM